MRYAKLWRQPACGWLACCLLLATLSLPRLALGEEQLGAADLSTAVEDVQGTTDVDAPAADGSTTDDDMAGEPLEGDTAAVDTVGDDNLPGGDAPAAIDVPDSNDQASTTEGAEGSDLPNDLSTEATEDIEVGLVNMYRLYNPNSGEHFYTASLEEAVDVAVAGWQWEGVGWVSPDTGDPVHRLYNANAGDHHYTTSEEERDKLVSLGWNYEGVGWYSGGSLAVLRQYNANAVAGSHNFTTSAEEDAKLAGYGWRSEGVAWHSSDVPYVEQEGFWLICQSWGPLSRYWVARDGSIAVDRLVTLEEGSPYLAYASSDHGAVLRGAGQLSNGALVLADNDGRLATETGFVASDSYGAGLQLYLLGDTDQGYSVARTGHIVIDGLHYWAFASTGALLRGKLPTEDVMLLADLATGRLEWTEGWLVTDVYDGETQRYYLCASELNDLIGARIGLFTMDGDRYYGREDQGYVVRGTYVISTYYGLAADGTGERYHDDTVAIADNDGRLLTREEVGALLVLVASSQIGASYDEEGSAYFAAENSADSSFNCSGFTWWVYSVLGLNISHNQGYYSFYTGEHNLQNSQMWGIEKRGAWKTKIEDLQPGDLVFFSPSPYYDKYHTGHVGVYIGDGLMIDSNTSEPYGVAVRSVRKATFVGGGLPITLV